MKLTGSVGTRSPFWSRILGLLISFAIVAVLVFGGAKNLMGELSEVYDALADSQTELALTQNELAATHNELAGTQNDLAATHNELDKSQRSVKIQNHLLQQSAHAFDLASNRIQRLTVEREDLKRGLREAANELATSNQQLMAADSAKRAAEAELERQLQQPQLSVVVTTERHFEMHQRESTAMSHVRMAFDGDAGTMYYEGMAAQHEMEQYTSYSERTQMVLTQTGPGEDVLECLNDRRRKRRCGMILATQSSAMQQVTYAYQSQYSSMQSLLWME